MQEIKFCTGIKVKKQNFSKVLPYGKNGWCCIEHGISKYVRFDHAGFYQRKKSTGPENVYFFSLYESVFKCLLFWLYIFCFIIWMGESSNKQIYFGKIENVTEFFAKAYYVYFYSYFTNARINKICFSAMSCINEKFVI